MAAPNNLRTTITLPNANATAPEGDEAAIDQSTQANAVRPIVDPTPTNKLVLVRVLPKGDGKVSKGEYELHSNSFPFYKRGEQFKLDRAIAEEQELNGFVEIMD